MLKKFSNLASLLVSKADKSTSRSKSLTLRAAIFESALDCIIVIDQHGLILEFNHAAEAVFGYSRVEVVGKNIAETIIPPLLRDQHRRGLAKYLATGEGPVLGKQIELTGMRADGAQFPVELMVTPLSGEAPPVFIGFLRDITERKRTGEALKRRASQLQTIAELSQTIAQVQNPNEIFPTAAKLISERFGFYHVGIFLIDHAREFAVLQATNSEGGRRMLERSHRLMLGTGVVGFAAQTGKPRIALDVGTDAVFFNNPDLPETRSEVALPLISGDRTIGVLDAQSTEAGAFSEDDLQVLNTLANQVAIALENARLLTEARASAIQVQEVYNEFVRTEWSRTAKNAEQAGFRYNIGRIEMLETPLQDAEIASAVETGNMVSNQVNGLGEKRVTVTVPVKLRGEVIGVLHVESNDPSRIWQENELSLMEAVAERAALAMENARLFQDARRRAAKERLISEATSRISASLNVENILQTTASELERVLGGSEVLIQFKSRDSA